MRQPMFSSLEAKAASASVAVEVPGAWQLLCMLAERARAGAPVCSRAAFAWHAGGWIETRARSRDSHGEHAPAEPGVAIDPEGGHVTLSAAASAEARTLLELFTPLVVGARAAALVIGHLGQSLDGRVATPTGVSQFITGPEDLVHTHRLRALFDAVVVGVRTVQLDDPQLTTRLVPGAHPTRVILDPQGKLDGGYKVLEDAAAPTLVCVDGECLPSVRRRGHVEWLGVACRERRFAPEELIAALRARGLARIFIEGGGVTVSRFLAARALDRLHVGIAPMILGSGAPAFALPPIDRLDEALSLRCRHFTLGNDVLFDCELTPDAPAAR